MKLALRLVAIAVVGVLLWLFMRRLEWDQLEHALARARVWPLVLSSLLYFVCLFGKALSWRIMLEPNNVVRMRRLFRYTIAAFAASALTPARAGELLRVWALKRRDGVPAADATAVALTEKLFDALTLLVFVAPIPWLLPRLPEWVGDTLLLCAGVGLGIFAVLWFAVGRIETTERSSWLARMIAGMHVVRSPRRLGLVAVTLLGVWVADLIAVMLVLHAVGIELPVAGGMFILFTFNLAIAVPSTPAQVGALQVGALVATTLLGIPREPALAFALLYQAMQVVPLLVIGLVLELDLVLGRVPREVDLQA